MTATLRLINRDGLSRAEPEALADAAARARSVALLLEALDAGDDRDGLLRGEIIRATREFADRVRRVLA